MNLINKRLWFKQYFELLPSSVKVRKESLFELAEFEISYENIHNKKIIQVSINHKLLYLSFIMEVIGTILLILDFKTEIWIGAILLGAVLFAVSLLIRIRRILVPSIDGNDISLFFNRKNKDQVMEFAEKIISHANNFLLQKFGKIDRYMPMDSQLNNIIFLRDREVISESEFEDLKKQLFGRDDKDSLGFQ